MVREYLSVREGLQARQYIFRALDALEHFVRGELLRHREKQEQMKKVMRSAYSKEYTDYICVDALGKLYTYHVITDNFGQLLNSHKLQR